MTTSPPDNWTPKDHALALALARGLGIEAAGKESGYAPRTVNARKADPAFRALVDTTRGAIVAGVVGKLVAAAVDAVDELAKLMKSADTDAARVSAARTILRETVSLQTHSDLLKRIEELEARAMKAKGRRSRP